MIKILALNSKTEKEETFIISSSICIDGFKESLKFIRNQTYGNWFRTARETKEFNSDISFPCNEMKYIVTSRDDTNQEEIIIFDKNINHDCMFEVLRFTDDGDVYRELVSAGFTNGLSCYGRSETLNCDSRPNLDINLLISKEK